MNTKEEQAFSAQREMCEQVLVTLRGIVRSIDLRSRKLDRECGLTVPQLIVLKAITRAGTVSVGELAEAVNLSGATVTGVLDRLEQRDCVVRMRSDQDKRRVMVEATARGRDVLEKAPSLVTDAFVREFLVLLPWEQTQMLATLQRVAAMMNAPPEAGPEALEGEPLPSVTREALEALPAEAAVDLGKSVGG